MRKGLIFKITSLSLLVFWCVLIFVFSAQNAENSSKTSGAVVTRVVETVYPDYKTLPKEKQQSITDTVTVMVRKTAHFSEYFVLGVFAFLTAVAYTKWGLKWRCATAFAFCVLYSVRDEWHQYFVVGRACRVTDMLIDSMGSLAAVILLLVITQKIKNSRLIEVG